MVAGIAENAGNTRHHIRILKIKLLLEERK